MKKGMTWKMENVPNEILDVAKEISRLSEEGNFWLVMFAYNKIGECRGKLKNYLVCKKELVRNIEKPRLGL